MPSPGPTFEVLADPTRLGIVERLRSGERNVGALASSLSVCQPGISRHLRILHLAGLVQVRAEGQKRFYSLRPQPFRDLDDWVHELRHLTEGRLDRLATLVEDRAPGSRSARPARWRG